MNDKPKPPEEKLENVNRRSFLLRLWRTEEPGASDWRASLEIPGTEKRIAFASMEQLFAYLIDLSESNNDLQQASQKR